MSRLCNFPQIGEFLNAQAISDTTHWGKRTLTLSVYTLLPWSSMVYIRCILVDEEPAERYDRTRIGAADRSGPGRDYADPVQSGIKVVCQTNLATQQQCRAPVKAHAAVCVGCQTPAFLFLTLTSEPITLKPDNSLPASLSTYYELDH
jgi:hypothetical protein